MERANVGRTTFYQHFTEKDDLFLSCHEAVASDFSLHPHSLEELVAPEAPPGMISAYRHVEHVRPLLYSILFEGKDSLLILRQIREKTAKEIEEELYAAFAGRASSVPLDALAGYLAGVQIATLQWWLEKRRPHTPEEFARLVHRLQCAAVHAALETGHGRET